MKVIESFKLRTKRFCLFYEFEKLWLILTIINVVAVFLIIRGSVGPLTSNNVVFEFLFSNDTNVDKTLYNIAISYFAAYTEPDYTSCPNITKQKNPRLYS